tara:strand:+ start:479 stop:670 length:192 start_codon:yes stop_codon:yes gene_type:complete
MSWFTQTEEAQKHIRECKGCANCIWIEESSWAMTEYGKPIVKKPIKHPLYDKIMEKFDGKEVK